MGSNFSSCNFCNCFNNDSKNNTNDLINPNFPSRNKNKSVSESIINTNEIGNIKASHINNLSFQRDITNNYINIDGIDDESRLFNNNPLFNINNKTNLTNVTATPTSLNCGANKTKQNFVDNIKNSKPPRFDEENNNNELSVITNKDDYANLKPIANYLVSENDEEVEIAKIIKNDISEESKQLRESIIIFEKTKTLEMIENISLKAKSTVSTTINRAILLEKFPNIQIIEEIKDFNHFKEYVEKDSNNAIQFSKYDAIENSFLLKSYHIEDKFNKNQFKEIISDEGRYLKLICLRVNLQMNQKLINVEDSIMQYYFGYADQFINKNGIGALISAKNKYIGMFKENAKCGQGRNVSMIRELFEGEFSDNLPNGRGKIYSLNNYFYFGEFSKGLQHGFGIEYNQNGVTYKGYFYEDMKHGKGILKLEDAKFIGEFKNNSLSGIAKIEYSDGKVYEGEVINFKLSGIGSYTWPDRRKYIGNYKNERRNGFGIMLFPVGIKYEGFWVDGNKHGLGIESMMNSSLLKEYRFNKVLRNLYNINDQVGNKSYRKMIDQINNYAVIIFERYYKILNSINLIEEEISMKCNSLNEF